MLSCLSISGVLSATVEIHSLLSIYAMIFCQASKDALRSCSEGVLHCFDQMRHIDKQSKGAYMKRTESWRETSAKVYEVVWPSLMQSSVKNEALLEDLEAEKDR